MRKYYLAIDIGASSGRHILGCVENGKIVFDSIERAMGQDINYVYAFIEEENKWKTHR